MWTAIFPIWARILIMIGALASIWALGDLHGHTAEGNEKDAEIGKLQHGFDERIAASSTALLAANARAAAQSQGATTDQSAIRAAYDKGKHDEEAAAKTRVADLISGRQRMRVDAICRPDAGGRGAVPGAPATARGSDGGATGYAELSPAAAGRFEAAADAVIGGLRQQVITLQAIAQSEHDRCNAGNAPVVETEPEANLRKRSTFRLGMPNPFH